MIDIFDAKIMCKSCDSEMEKGHVDKQGFKLRAVRCKKCGGQIIHPDDSRELAHYRDLKRKTYNVKLRIIGNSHAISIPKEVVDFINDTNKRMSNQMDDMVKLCFEDFGKMSLRFFDGNPNGGDSKPLGLSHKKQEHGSAHSNVAARHPRGQPLGMPHKNRGQKW